MYRVVYKFKDLKDPKVHVYQAGDTYPRAGFKVSESRLEELSSTKNKLKKVLIEKVVEKEEAPAPEVEEVKELKKQNKKKKAKD